MGAESSAILIASIISSVTSAAATTASSIYSTNRSVSYSASDSETSRAFSSSEAQKSREYDEYMYDKQVKDTIASEERANAEWRERLGLSSDASKDLTQWLQDNFNSPSAQVAALRKAGINPSALYGSGGQSPFGSITAAGSADSGISASGAPSHSSGIMASTPSTHMPNTNYDFGGSELAGLSQAFLNFSQAEHTQGIESRDAEMFPELIKYQKLISTNQEIKNQQDQLNLCIDKLYKDKKEAQELKLITAKALWAGLSANGQELLAHI